MSDAQVALVSALAKVVDASGVSCFELGLNAYEFRRTWRAGFRKRHIRLARVKFASNPPPSNIVWDPGKGVIGECARRGDQVIAVAFYDSHKRYLNCNEDTWAKASVKMRMGLSFSEWVTTQRYALIIAVPVQQEIDGHYGYRGCLSLDTTRTENVEKLNTSQVQELLRNAAEIIEKSFKATT